MRKSILIPSILIISLIFTSCSNRYSDSELKANFTAKEIADLNEIRLFFIDQVCESDFKSCYEKADHDSLQASGHGIWANIDFKEQQKLYEKISKSTFNEIWMICKSTNYSTKAETKSICANATGKYQKYLSDLGKQNPKIAKYAEDISKSGDFYGPEMMPYYILNDPENFNLNDPNIQLIIGIHYLPLNDQLKRNEKWTEN